jgi:hypothetical protein
LKIVHKSFAVNNLALHGCVPLLEFRSKRSSLKMSSGDQASIEQAYRRRAIGSSSRDIRVLFGFGREIDPWNPVQIFSGHARAIKDDRYQFNTSLFERGYPDLSSWTIVCLN